MTPDEALEKAQAGAEWLDEHIPFGENWRDNVDVGELRIHSPLNCILAQLHTSGCYAKATDDLEIPALLRFKLGFSINTVEESAVLDKAWRQVIVG